MIRDVEQAGRRRAALAWSGSIAVVCAFIAAACGGRSRDASGGAANPVHVADAASATGAIKIVFLGDSVTAGLGLLTDEAYPSEIGRRFEADGYHDVEVVNAGVSGDTTASGLSRLDDILEPGVKLLVVALGGNDALRGISPADTRDNVSAIVTEATSRGVGVVLVGMLPPPNLGPDYRDAFTAAFTSVAAANRSKVTFVPFLLEGVAGIAALNQPDGIHPTAAGAKVIADHLYPVLRNAVDALQ